MINYCDFLARSLLNIYQYATQPTGESRKINSVIKATSLKNAEGAIPSIRSSKPTTTGTQYSLSLPAGITLKEFIDRKSYFETYLNAQVDFFPPNGPTLLMQVNRTEFPDIIPYEFNPPNEMLAPIPVGITPTGELIYADIATFPNMIIGGLPGYGKTSLLKGWTVALTQAGCKVLVIDRKQIDFPELSPFINVALTEEESFSLVQSLLKENEQRQALIRSHKHVYKYADLPEQVRKQNPYLVLIVDEAAEIRTPETYQAIDSLTRLGRAAGISVILATQKASAKLWDQNFSNTRDMCAGRISFYVADYMTSQVILGKGNTNAARLPMIKGRAVTLLGDRERILQTLYLNPSKAETMLENLKCTPYFKAIEVQPIPQKEKPKRGRPRKKKEETK